MALEGNERGKLNTNQPFLPNTRTGWSGQRYIRFVLFQDSEYISSFKWYVSSHTHINKVKALKRKNRKLTLAVMKKISDNLYLPQWREYKLQFVSLWFFEYYKLFDSFYIFIYSGDLFFFSFCTLLILHISSAMNHWLSFTKKLAKNICLETQVVNHLLWWLL